MLADLQRANEAIHAATGLRPRLFRPPYGVTIVSPAPAPSVTRRRRTDEQGPGRLYRIPDSGREWREGRSRISCRRPSATGSGPR